MDGIASGVTVTHTSGSDSSVLPGENARLTVTVSNTSTSVAANISTAQISLGSTVGTGGTNLYPVIQPQGTGANSTTLQIAIPSSLRCGSVAEFTLTLTGSFGQLNLPVRVRVGRPIPSLQNNILREENVDGAQIRWKLTNFTVATGVAHSGTKAFHAVDTGNQTDDRLLCTLFAKKRIPIPSDGGHIRLTFWHSYDFEPGYDGGVIEISTDGDTWTDLGSRIITGGYDGKLTDVSRNPLGIRYAWTARGNPGVFTQVVIDLDDFAGQQNVKIRFRAGFDMAGGIDLGYTGWYIDDLRVTTDEFSCGS